MASTLFYRAEGANPVLMDDVPYTGALPHDKSSEKSSLDEKVDVAESGGELHKQDKPLDELDDHVLDIKGM